MVVGRRLDERSGQLSMKSRLRQGRYDVNVNVYDVIWKHEVVSTVTVVVKEIDDVAIANAGSLRIQGDISFQSLAEVKDDYDVRSQFNFLPSHNCVKQKFYAAVSRDLIHLIISIGIITIITIISIISIKMYWFE